MKVDIAHATVSNSGSGTSISNAAALGTMFTASQLNRLAEKYLGKKFNKVAAKKMAEKMWDTLVAACGAIAEKAAPGLGRGGKMYSVVHAEKDTNIEGLPPQAALFVEILHGAVKKGETKDFTKAELLELFAAGGFKTRGNPWNNFHFYRKELIRRGVMK